MFDMDTDWSYLPEVVMCEVLQLLEYKDRVSVSRTCHRWYNCFHVISLWKIFTFNLQKSNIEEGSMISLLAGAEALINQHIDHLHDITILVDKTSDKCTQALIELLNCMARLNEFGFYLHRLKIVHTNYTTSFKPQPDTYGALQNLLALQENISELDLEKFSLPITDALVLSMSKRNPNVKNLYLENGIEHVILNSQAVHDMVLNCRKLKRLSLAYISLNEDIVKLFNQSDRSRLVQLDIFCTRQDKLQPWITDPDNMPLWKQLFAANPKLMLGIKFNETTLYQEVEQIMSCDFLRVNRLVMCTYTMLEIPLKLCSENFADTLEYFDIAGQSGQVFNDALLLVARSCLKLKEVIIRTRTGRAVIEEFINLHVLKKPGFKFRIHDPEGEHVWRLREITSTNCQEFL